MKVPSKPIKKSYRSTCLSIMDDLTHSNNSIQKIVQIKHINIYLYVHICITNSFDQAYFIIKYLACVQTRTSQDKSIYLPTKKLDLNIDTSFQIKLNSNTTLHICKMQTLINPNLLEYKINYLYLPKLETNIDTIKKLFDIKPLYYMSGLNQRKLIEYKQDEMENLEKLLDNLNV